MRTCGGRAGSALPVSILFIGLMTAGVMASLARIGAEQRMAEHETAAAWAAAVADSAVSEAIARGLMGETVLVYEHGTARVNVSHAGDANCGSELYRIRAIGRTSGLRGRMQARHVVERLAARTREGLELVSDARRCDDIAGR